MRKNLSYPYLSEALSTSMNITPYALISIFAYLLSVQAGTLVKRTHTRIKMFVECTSYYYRFNCLFENRNEYHKRNFNNSALTNSIDAHSKQRLRGSSNYFSLRKIITNLNFLLIALFYQFSLRVGGLHLRTRTAYMRSYFKSFLECLVVQHVYV